LPAHASEAVGVTNKKLVRLFKIPAVARRLGRRGFSYLSIVDGPHGDAGKFAISSSSCGIESRLSASALQGDLRTASHSIRLSAEGSAYAAGKDANRHAVRKAEA